MSSAQPIQDTQTLSIRVIGAGTVGEATGRALDDWGHDVTFTDIDDDVLADLDRRDYDTAALSADLDVDLTLISVPSPYDEETGQYSLAAVESAVETVADQAAGVVAIRSTVPPGTTERLAAEYGLEDYAMVPEFLFADTAYEDIQSAESVVIGSGSHLASRVLRMAFDPQVTAVIELDPTEAEFVKLASNAFAATKISFANEVWRVARRYAADQNEPVDGNAILSAFRAVCPWHDPSMGLEGGRPYGGHCLPKDTRGFYGWAYNEHQYSMPQLSGTIAENDLMGEFDD